MRSRILASSEEGGRVIQRLKTRKPRLSIRLPAGSYTYRVRGLDSHGALGPWSAPYPLSVPSSDAVAESFCPSVRLPLRSIVSTPPPPPEFAAPLAERESGSEAADSPTLLWSRRGRLLYRRLLQRSQVAGLPGRAASSFAASLAYAPTRSRWLFRLDAGMGVAPLYIKRSVRLLPLEAHLRAGYVITDAGSPVQLLVSLGGLYARLVTSPKTFGYGGLNGPEASLAASVRVSTNNQVLVEAGIAGVKARTSGSSSSSPSQVISLEAGFRHWTEDGHFFGPTLDGSFQSVAIPGVDPRFRMISLGLSYGI